MLHYRKNPFTSRWLTVLVVVVFGLGIARQALAQEGLINFRTMVPASKGTLHYTKGGS